MSDPRRRLTGRLPETLISALSIPRHATDYASRLRRLADASCAVADALDELGVGGCVDASVASPLVPTATIAGPAVTLRYRRLDGDVTSNRVIGRGNVFGDRDLYGLGEPGDIAVFDCPDDSPGAVMGALSAKWAGKAQIAGCVVSGSIRDTASIVAAGIPVWSRGVRPEAARYRLDVAELNGPVSVGGVPVAPGDYVVADRNGVAVIPFAVVPDVVDRCEAAEVAEARLLRVIDAAADLADLVARTSGGGTPT
ncbi:RraA family protein [Gordonia hydrophobica]|uniref:Putative 4-hydroxy-4-methyl-2-oxoglutarate aldolase n=1 Tax=Gordonia hydrophobica TaxID=40516 RepID=A0ABZ2U238_9ACTN|nr:RraA family protein [Gordonia hydrophobica]MBM7366728.1 regulator of RNase E activity RraA [Gordonia hydrophobica]